MLLSTENPLEKDFPLKDDIRLLGMLLGDTLRQQEGELTYQLIERIRQAAIKLHREPSTQEREALRQLLNGLSDEHTIKVVRAFSLFAHLTNIAEDLHHNRRRRAYLKAHAAPQVGSFSLALQRLKMAHISPSKLQSFSQSPYFTGTNRPSDRSTTQKCPRYPTGTSPPTCCP